jgi:hypothetical protein
MKLLVQSFIIFFGTLMAAAIVALGDPATSAPGQAAATSAPSFTGARVAGNESTARAPR